MGLSARRLGHGVTDSRGRFSIIAEIETNIESIERARGVVAHKQSYAMAWDFRESPGERSDEEFNLVLGPCTRTAGRVVDQASRPVARAKVRIVAAELWEKPLPGIDFAQVLSTETDDNGVFVFDILPAEATFELMVIRQGTAVFSSRGICRCGTKLSFEAGAEDIEIVTSGPLRLSGVIADGHSNPVSCVGVRLYIDPYVAGIDTVSDEQGRFEFDCPGPGEYLVMVRGDREAGYENIFEKITVGRSPGQDIRINLSRPGTLEVFVKDRKSGKPVADSDVLINPAQTNQLIVDCSKRTDPDGKASFKVRPGEYSVTAVGSEIICYQNQAVTVKSEQVSTVDVGVAADERKQVSGFVYGPDGQPISGADLVWEAGGRGRSDGSGKFCLEYNTPGVDLDCFLLYARDKGRNLAAAVEFTQKQDKLEVHLEPGLTIGVRAVDEYGQPLAGVMVSLDIHRQTHQGLLCWPLEHREHYRCDCEGFVEIPAIALADVTYEVTLSGQAHGAVSVEVSPGDAVEGLIDAGTFALPEAILGVRGKVVSDALVVATGADKTFKSTRSDAEGNFIIENLVAGKVQLEASASELIESTSEATMTMAGADDVVVVASN